jgi:hypothetical protein
MKSASFLDNLNTAARENPVAAGLVGMGLAWIFLGKSGAVFGEATVARSAKRAITKTVDTATGAVSGAVDQARQAARGVSDALSQGVEAAGDRISDTVAGLKTSKNEARSEFERHFAPPTSGGLADLLDRQPLVLAAVGVAIGAAIATAFPSTDIEDRVMGTAGGKLKETLEEATVEVAVRAGSVIDAVADEAAAQNLTPEAAKQAIRAGAVKVKTVAEAGLNSSAR